MTTTNKGFWRGVLYPLIAFVIHAGLAYLSSTGWLTAAGAVALTGLVGYIDHSILPVGSY